MPVIAEVLPLARAKLDKICTRLIAEIEAIRSQELSDEHLALVGSILSRTHSALARMVSEPGE